MKRLYCLWIVAIVAVVLAVGCRSSRETVAPDAPHSRTCGYDRLTGTFDCEVEGVSVKGLLRTECDSVIWITVSKIIELGRLRLTPDSVAGYVKIYNRYFAGTYEDVYRQTGVRTSFAEVQKKFSDAYERQTRQVPIDVDARQWTGRIVLAFSRLEASTAPLSYPFHIPSGAQPIIRTSL